MNYLRLAILTLFASTSTLLAGQISLPTTLDKLAGSDDFVVVGDLKFDEFSYPEDSTVQGNMPFASQITVRASNGDDGIRFDGAFFDLPGGVGNGASDATIGFDVTAMSGAITGATLHGNPSLKGGATGIAEVVETFEGIADRKLVIFDKTATLSLISKTDFDMPMTSLTVLKDILLFTESDTNSATISVIDQEFTLVPEPTAIIGMLLGVLGISLLRRRRRA